MTLVVHARDGGVSLLGCSRFSACGQTAPQAPNLNLTQALPVTTLHDSLDVLTNTYKHTKISRRKHRIRKVTLLWTGIIGAESARHPTTPADELEASDDIRRSHSVPGAQARTRGIAFHQ